MEPMPQNNLETLSQEYTSINYRQEKRVNAIQKKGCHVTVAYLAFQAIILNAITQSRSSLVKCTHWWIPFTLSFLVSLIYGVTLNHIALQFLRMRYQLDLNRLEHEMIRCEIHMVRVNGIDVGNNSRFKRDQLRPDPVAVFKRKTYACFIAALLFAFATLMLYACRAFWCENKE